MPTIGRPGIRSRLRARFAVLLLASFALAGCAHAQHKVLYEKPSAYSHIIVTEEAGERILRFEPGGARQSVARPGDADHLALPYARVALVGLALCGEPRRMLVIGLGGGTLPTFLRKHYPDATIDAVDIDPDVVHVSREYFGFREDAAMRAHVADGRRFIEQTRQPYDIIFLDAFGSRNVPAHMTTEEFLAAVRRAVRPDGVVVGNIWSSAHNPLYDAMVRTYREVFDGVRVLRVQDTGNRIVLALPRKETLDSEALAQRAARISAHRGFRFDLGDVARASPDTDRAASDARVLRDVQP